VTMDGFRQSVVYSKRAKVLLVECQNETDDR
jgi:hypothetical protein